MYPRQNLQMARNQQSTIRLRYSRFATVFACLCVIAVMPFPQLDHMSCTELSHAKIPLEQDGKCCEEQLIVVTTLRHCIHCLRCDARGSHEPDAPARLAVSFTCAPQAIVGHFLANGLRAPLVI